MCLCICITYNITNMFFCCRNCFFQIYMWLCNPPEIIWIYTNYLYKGNPSPSPSLNVPANTSIHICNILQESGWTWLKCNHQPVGSFGIPIYIPMRFSIVDLQDSWHLHDKMLHFLPKTPLADHLVLSNTLEHNMHQNGFIFSEKKADLSSVSPFNSRVLHQNFSLGVVNCPPRTMPPQANRPGRHEGARGPHPPPGQSM